MNLRSIDNTTVTRIGNQSFTGYARHAFTRQKVQSTTATFKQALDIAKSKYPHEINHYEEYKDYFVFDYDDGEVRTGGPLSPVVVRKSDSEALNYESVFFDLSDDAEDVGGIISEGHIE